MQIAGRGCLDGSVLGSDQLGPMLELETNGPKSSPLDFKEEEVESLKVLSFGVRIMSSRPPYLKEMRVH